MPFCYNDFNMDLTSLIWKHYTWKLMFEQYFTSAGIGMHCSGNTGGFGSVQTGWIEFFRTRWPFGYLGNLWCSPCWSCDYVREIGCGRRSNSWIRHATANWPTSQSSSTPTWESTQLVTSKQRHNSSIKAKTFSGGRPITAPRSEITIGLSIRTGFSVMIVSHCSNENSSFAEIPNSLALSSLNRISPEGFIFNLLMIPFNSAFDGGYFKYSTMVGSRPLLFNISSVDLHLLHFWLWYIVYFIGFLVELVSKIVVLLYFNYNITRLTT